MKILVTGSNGQLGSELRRLSLQYPDHEFIFTDIPELDILDHDSVGRFFMINRPDTVINCAGYTAVDKAETDHDKAFELNGVSVGNLALQSSKTGALFIHISTDYVFNGTKSTPYMEEDIPDPQSVYAKSKFEGEQQVMKNASRGIIIRTSWLYSEFMNNFVKTVIIKGRERGNLNVVYDQTGGPTYARDLAETILKIIPDLKDHQGVEIFHYSNEGVASWYDFARAIVELSGITCRIEPILTEQYPLPAVRPAYSVMDKTKIKKRFGIEIPYWRVSLKECLHEITNDELRITNIIK
jgi:dTDP-4-dehydrorhamnose reductase